MSLNTFVTQYRAELLADLQMTPSIACPTCVINYVDNELPDTCNTDCCQYEFEAPTSDAEILSEWTEGVLREAYRTAGIRLYLKWAERLGRPNDDRLLVNTLRKRHLYENYDLEELGRILDALRADGVTLDTSRWQNWMNAEEYALLLLKQSAETE